MLMKSVFRNTRNLGFSKILSRPFAQAQAAAPKEESNGSMNIRFHDLYVKELERIQKTT
jgi:hypothetical protein